MIILTDADPDEPRTPPRWDGRRLIIGTVTSSEMLTLVAMQYDNDVSRAILNRRPVNDRNPRKSPI